MRVNPRFNYFGRLLYKKDILRFLKFWSVVFQNEDGLRSDSVRVIHYLRRQVLNSHSTKELKKNEQYSLKLLEDWYASKLEEVKQRMLHNENNINNEEFWYGYGRGDARRVVAVLTPKRKPGRPRKTGQTIG